MEEWRVIADAPDYAVSSAGRVRRETPGHLTAPGRIQDPQPNKGCREGYLRVTLRLADRTRRVRTVHRLVCETFHGPPPFRGAQVAHLDGTRIHNAAANLRWKTAQGNADDRQAHGQTVRGVRHHEAKLDPEKVRAIRSSSLTVRAAAEAYGVSKATISRVRNKTWWRHVEDETVARKTAAIAKIQPPGEAG